jgi:hypothetical protein
MAGLLDGAAIFSTPVVEPSAALSPPPELATA